MGTIAENLARIQSAKTDIRTAIEAKGVTVPSSATIDTYDTYVSQISGGGGGGNPIIKSIDVEDFTGTTFNPYGNYITDITIPSGVTSIGARAFQNCVSLTSVTIPSGVTSISNYAFSYCSGLISIDIPSGVTSIGTNAFEYCGNLTSVTIPSGITSIGNYTFTNCTSLTSIVIPNSVTSIGNQAFSNCTGLTTCTIGSGVTSIGGNVFQNCRSLTSVIVEATAPPSLGSNSFANTNNCPIYVPAASVDTYKAASGWSTYASRIQAIPSPTPPEPSYTYVLMDTNFDTSTPVYGAIMSWVDNEDNDMPFDFFGDQEASEFPYYGSITYDDINDEYTVTIWDYTSTEIYQETFSSEPITLDFIEIVGQPVYFSTPSMYVCLDEECIEYDEETGDCLEEGCVEEGDVYFATAKIIQQN